ncbi:Leo1-like protein-domain-containing protein [Boletus edulis BED1]|uniref:Leo1-like protein-domain-containing protein n=1 Tax=Boletus edulis BED1 TaxID=1328754 RepID=A0AAD4C5T7_BOLED|nr:Leo1-like protein-domain-containing protein [Boletus edulis BED1]
MSSLAGALEETVRYNHTYPSTLSPVAHDRDVDMETPEVKEEPNLILEQAVVPVGGDEHMDDLFGQEAEMDEARQVKSETSLAATPAGSGYDSDELSQTEKERRRLEYMENDEPTPVVSEVQEANVSIPNIPVPRTSDGDHWVFRVPNFVKVDSKPFHPDTYVGPEQDEDTSHPNESAREKSMSIKLKVENTVRWRWIKDEFGQDRRQSNSRIIRWSDGSLSLRLGKELFDINQSIDTSGGVVRQSIGGSQSASQSTPSASQSSGLKSQGLTYLVAQHKRSEVLQAEAVITGYMTLRPTGMQSETHRMLVRAVGQKHNKVARLRMAPEPTMDLEREKQELVRLSARKSKKKSDDAGFGTRRKRSSSQRKRAGHDVWTDDDEPEYEGSEDEGEARASKRKAELRKGGEYQEDDFVVADESDEDGGYGEGSGKRRRHREEEEDPLDRLDAKIDQQREEERKRKGLDSLGEDNHDMDVESEEEEEEEHKMRKAKSGTRKTKRTITFEEDEQE